MAHRKEQFNYHPDEAEFPNCKDTDQVCRPSKKLHLNLKGHTQSVNCIRWNVTESNNHLLLSALMNHKVCVWDTRKGGACTQSFTCHTELKMPNGVTVGHKCWVVVMTKLQDCLMWKQVFETFIVVYKQSCKCTTSLYIMKILSKRQVIRWGKHN